MQKRGERAGLESAGKPPAPRILQQYSHPPTDPQIKTGGDKYIIRVAAQTSVGISYTSFSSIVEMENE
eukprot:117732-Ditylum_brightwellii.AAC.1